MLNTCDGLTIWLQLGAEYGSLIAMVAKQLVYGRLRKSIQMATALFGDSEFDNFSLNVHGFKLEFCHFYHSLWLLRVTSLLGRLWNEAEK